jgi:hypothetical protein
MTVFGGMLLLCWLLFFAAIGFVVGRYAGRKTKT